MPEDDDDSLKTEEFEALKRLDVEVEIAEVQETIAGLTGIYLRTENAKLGARCRQTIQALMQEYGPEKE